MVPPSPTPPSQPAAILCVDADAAGRRALGQCLDQAGFRIWEASSPAEALERAGEGPALVIVKSGQEVCRRLRGNPATAALPLLLLIDAPANGTESQLSCDAADALLVAPYHPAE